MYQQFCLVDVDTEGINERGPAYADEALEVKMLQISGAPRTASLRTWGCSLVRSLAGGHDALSDLQVQRPAQSLRRRRMEGSGLTWTRRRRVRVRANVGLILHRPSLKESA